MEHSSCSNLRHSLGGVSGSGSFILLRKSAAAERGSSLYFHIAHNNSAYHCAGALGYWASSAFIGSGVGRLGDCSSAPGSPPESVKTLKLNLRLSVSFSCTRLSKNYTYATSSPKAHLRAPAQIADREFPQGVEL